MVRVITQETYDEVVNENIEEFNMTPQEAIDDAIAQFEAQGVDLTNIIKDMSLGSGDVHIITATINKLRGLSPEDEGIVQELDVLKTECGKDLARRLMAGKEGAYNILINILEASKLKYSTNNRFQIVFVKVLETLNALMDTQPDLLDDKGICLIKSILEEIDDEKVLTETLKWTSTCCIKHEMNRQNIYAKNIIQNLKTILSDNKKNIPLVSASLQCARKLTLDDDIRHEFGKAHDHATNLAINLLEPLMALLKENTNPPLVGELTLTIASMLVRNEFCAMAAENGLDVLFTILADNYDNVAVISQTVKLIIALAGNDDVKRSLVKCGIVQIIVSLLNRYSSTAATVALILKSMSALSLREPTHGKEFLENGAPEAIVDVLKQHPDNASIQKNGCWAVRNMVARCRDHNQRFHELGIEDILNDAYKKYEKDFGFDIKSALRDLECDVKLDEQWTGSGKEIEQ